MRIRKIRYENYRCFMNGEIEFPTNDSKNMTVLVAPNGGGKTESLFSFWWTLYDFDFSKLRNKENTAYAINSKLYRELENDEIGASRYCKTELEFDASGVSYFISKRCEYRKTGRQIKVETYRELSKKKPNGELELPIRDSEEIDKVLNKIIPKSILYGIIFDGERMQKLSTSNEDSINAIRGVINDITNVELLENCKTQFASEKRVHTRSLRTLDQQIKTTTLDKIVNELTSIEQELLDNEAELKKCEEEFDEVERRVGEISELLQKNKEVKEIESKRSSEREKLSRNENDLDSLYKDFSAQLKNTFLAASSKLLEDVEKIINEYDIPRHLTAPAVRSIIERDTCICGKCLDEEAKRILELLVSSLPPDNINSTLGEMVRHIRIEIEAVKNRAKEAYEKIQKCEDEIKANKETIASYSARISSLEVTGHEAEEAILLESENIAKIERIGQLKVLIPQTKEKIKDNRARIDKLRGQRDNFTSGSILLSSANAKIRFIEKCEAAIERIMEINKANALDDINAKLQDAYEKLSEDAERGRKIKIIQFDPQKKYQIAVYLEETKNKTIARWIEEGTYQTKLTNGMSEDQIEEEAILKCLDSNSTGQSKINTFSFVKAILDYSNTMKSNDIIETVKDYPLLIDAPFGDIASENLRKSSTELHNFASQVILMIDEDKFEALRAQFDPFICAKYTFKKVDNANHSVIERVGV